MLITYLELENFKSYASERIAFLPGTNAIIGANGAGKSTLLEAIGFVLFGHQEQRMRLASLLREGAQMGRAVVGLVSSYDEREYEVERCFTAKATTRYRVYDRETGQCLAEGTENVLAWLHQHLCVEPPPDLHTLFENTIGVPQGTFTAPFLQIPSARKAIFDPLLQVEEYKKAGEKLRDTENWLEREINKLQADIANMRGQLATVPTLRQEEETLTEALRDLERRIATLQEQIESLEREASALDRVERQVRDLDSQLQQKEASLKTHESLLQSESHLLAAAEAAQRQVDAARAGYEAYRKAEKQLSELERQRRERDQLLQDRARLEAQLAHTRAQLDALEKELAEIASLAERMRELEPAVAKQRELEKALRRAEEETLRLEAAQRREREAAEEVHKAEATVEQRKLGLLQAKSLEQALAQKRQAIEALNLQQQASREERARVLAELERLRKQSATLKESETARCPVCESELSPARRDELLARNKQLIQELELMRANLDEQSSDYERRVSELKAELDSGQQRLAKLPSDEDLQEAQEHLAERRNLLEQVQAEVQALAEAPMRAQALRQELEALGDPLRTYQHYEARVQLEPDKVEKRQQALVDQRTLQAKIDQVKDALAVFATLDEEWGAAQRIRDENREAYDTYVANLKLAQQAQTHRERVNQLALELEKLQQEKNALSAQYEQALSTYDAEHHQKLKARLDALKQERAACQAEAQEKARRLASVHQEVKRLEALERELTQKEADSAELKRLHRLLRDARDLLRKASPYITQSLVQQVSYEASALYGDIIGDHSGRLQWSEDYELSLDVKGHKRAFHQLSGGEQMSAALALRLALLRRISAIDVAFFDEPTAHLDPERREGLAERITQVRGFSQLFVISHDDTFERAAQNYIRIVKDAQGSRQEKV